MTPKRISVKFFSQGGAPIELEPFVPLFHRFVQRASVEGLLIDVADYAHVPNGPGVLLVGHDVDYGIDHAAGRPGLLTVRKRGGDAPLPELLADVLRKALIAVKAIEADGAAKVRFDLGAAEIAILDRLAAANRDEDAKQMRAAVETVVARVFGVDASLSRSGADDPRKPLTFEVRARRSESADALLARLGEPAAAPVAAEPAPPRVPGQSAWDISVEQLHHLRENGFDFVLIDVREEHEVEICEIGGRLIPLGTLGDRIEELDREAHIVVHCHLGGRSAAAVKTLRSAGFGNAWNLQGGIRAWIERIDPDLQDY
jgi:adenylyltransferase/sulfurtransferase